MNSFFVNQRIDRVRFLKSQERSFRRRYQTDFAPAIFAPGSDKMSLALDNINFGRFDHDFRTEFSHKTCLPGLAQESLKHIFFERPEKFSCLSCGKKEYVSNFLEL